MNIKIITHTGCDLPLAEAKELGISVVPDVVIFDGVEYAATVEMTPEIFYERLKTATKLPTSSHPIIGEMAECMVEASKDADEILCIAITSKMSGTYASFVTASEIAKKNGAECPIYVYDTLQCSHAMGEMVREAKRQADAGLTSTEIMTELDSYRDKMGMYFILDTLKYARKGGRVGAIKSLAADAVGIKPLLVFTDGVVKDIGIARNFDDGISKVVDKYREEADFSKPLTIFHLEAMNKVEILKKQILEINPDAKIMVDYVGPVIGIYAGYGGAGLQFVKK